MIQKFSCPSCAAELVFRSNASVSATCPSCRSLVVRHGTDLELIGKVSDLIDDMSVLQPRTKGRFQGRAFDILGRCRVAWEDGFWNEWCCESDGKNYWLSEAQGFFVYYSQVDELPAPTTPLDAGQNYQAPNGDHYEITDIKKARVVGVEGELPLKVKLEEEYTSIDLRKDDKHHATLDIRPAGAKFFYGTVGEFADFKFEYLRQIDGW